MTVINNENGVFSSYIATSRFKTTLISVGFYLPLDEDACANALALNLMKSGTEAYPDTYSLNRRLAHLYGASVTSWVSKVGDCQELRIGITVNDDKYSFDGESTVSEAGELLCDMIFGHFLHGTDYTNSAIEREKRLLCEKIAGKLNDKRTYARSRCEEIICPDEPYGISPDGDVQTVEALQSADIRNAFEKIIKTSLISVQVIGEQKPQAFFDRFDDCIKAAGRSFAKLPEDIVHSPTRIKRVTEEMPVKQGKLVMGLRSENGGSDRETVAVMVMCDIFGGGPYSKLFCNVREKMSLCYYCSARSIRRKGIILVDSGIEKENTEKAEQAILAQLSDMADGNFTDKEMTSSKLALCDMIHSVESEQASLARWYGSRALESDPATPDEICGIIESITREDIIAAAKSFKLDTVYCLSPDGTVKEEE